MVEHNDSSINRRIWKDSGYTPKDMDAAQIYDGTLISSWWGLEVAGFCGEGEAFEFVQNGRIELNGELPLNTFGGSINEGRTHGMGHFYEAVLQISKRAGARQVPDCHRMYVQTGSPMTRNQAFIFSDQSE